MACLVQLIREFRHLFRVSLPEAMLLGAVSRLELLSHRRRCHCRGLGRLGRALCLLDGGGGGALLSLALRGVRLVVCRLLNMRAIRRP